MIDVRISKALSIYINELVYDIQQTDRVCTLSLGEAFFDLPTLDFTKYETNELVHYCSSYGLPELRMVLSQMYNASYGTQVAKENVLVTSGSKIAIYLVLLGLKHRGKKVALLEPAWLSYEKQIELVGSIPTSFGFDTDLRTVADSLDESYSAVIVNNPNNPSGLNYRAGDIEYLVDKARMFGIVVISDEAYSDFVPETDQFSSFANFVLEHSNVIVVNSLSKNIGMSGFRIGYIIARDDVIEKIVKLNQHLITCAPTILQRYIADNLISILSNTRPQIAELLDKRAKILKYLDERGIGYLPGNSTFYFMLEVKSKLNAYAFSMNCLLWDRIAVVPGEAYGESTGNFVRVSIGTESTEDIINALDVLINRMDAGWPNNNFLDELSRRGLPTFS